VGKTTTKELTAAVLSKRFPTGRSTGNLNNAIGLPLEVARMPDDVKVAVLEMGMSTPGEIHRLSELFRPDVAVVTAVAPVHLVNFASLDAVRDAKGEILDGMSPHGTYVANADDARSVEIGTRHGGRVVAYGLAGSDELFATARDIAETETGTRFTLRLGGESTPVELPLPGRHNVSNFLAAAAIAGVLGMAAREVAAAAPDVKPAKHRGEVKELLGGGLLYDDSYNSSPVALTASFAAFERAAGARRKVAVVGEMRELGPESPRFHREAGKSLAGRCDLLVAVHGDAREIAAGAREAGMREDAVRFAESVDAAIPLVKELLAPGDAVFVKGSRGVALDKLVDTLVEAL
jgi:UDP-N-acetylmuramoyl-tripeptide--D-alanyl-D-alanine ligase